MSDCRNEKTDALRVCLVIPGMGTGGAERVLAQLANHWAALGWQVSLLTFAGRELPVYQALSPEIALRPLDLMRPSRGLREGILNNLRRVARLRQAIRESRPDAVLSFIDQANITTLAATLGLGIPVVVSERVDPAHHDIGRLWSALRSLLYPFATAVVVQTTRVAAQFRWLTRRRIVVLPNMIPAPAHSAQPAAGDGREGVIGGVGRLVRQKGFDLLIAAFARIADRHPSWRLKIWGDGPERPALERQVAETGLGNRIELAGVTAQPGGWIEDVDLFVLSSRYEGFPNVLGEAMAAGLPVVAFDCPSGPRDIIREGGLLVAAEDIGALSDALDRAIKDGGLRRTLGNAARSDIARYSPEIVLDEWTRLLKKASCQS